ncbi:uncharacterized protein [Coffea arabica]|uniref:Uncharacterized protein isoform X2 n=1 Tax=Coffea arabica TaxID=13443 RepID=A0ABM4X0M2_COFAR
MGRLQLIKKRITYKAVIIYKTTFSGNERLTKYCRKLGMLQFSGIPPAPRGVPKIKATFHVDSDGLLHVTAEDKATNNSKSITMDKLWMA